MWTANTMDIATRYGNAMNKRQASIQRMLKDLKAEGVTEREYFCPNVRWEDQKRWYGSVVGPEIADVAAFVCQEGTFCKINNGTPVAIDDAGLVQVIKRAQALAEALTPVHKTVKAHGCWTSNTDAAYVVNTTEGPWVFDYTGKGSVHKLSDSVVDDWVAESSEVHMTDFLRGLCNAAATTGEAQRIDMHGRAAYVLPQITTGAVSFFNVVEGKTIEVAKKKRLTLQNIADPADYANANVSDELYQCYKTMNAGHARTTVYRTAGGAACVVVPDAVVGKYLCLNAEGPGRHVVVEYMNGFNLPLFCIRTENRNETVIQVPLHKFQVVMTTPAGTHPEMMMLYDVLEKAGAFGKHAGLDENVNLALDKDKEAWFTLRLQAYICPEGDGVEVFERLFSYQSTDHCPTTLVTYHTGFGTSWCTPTTAPLKIQPTKFDAATGELSGFNLSVKASNKKAGDMATYTKDESRANLVKGCAMAVPLGPLGFPFIANGSVMCQWPVVSMPKITPRKFGKDECEPILRSLVADDGECEPKFRSAGLPEGDLMASETGYGSYQGKHRGVAVGSLQRRHSAGTGTFSIFFTVKKKAGETNDALLPGEVNVSKEDVREVVKILDNLHKIAGDAVRIFDKGVDVCANAPTFGSPEKKQRFNVGVIEPPSMMEVAM